MTQPANVRVNIGSPFPRMVKGAGFIIVAKIKGIWTIEPAYQKLAEIFAFADPTTKLVVLYDALTKAYNTISLATFAAQAVNSYRTVTAAGDVNVAPGDVVILMDKLVGAATNIVLPLSAARNGLPLTVKDLKYDANANNIRFVLADAETIDGFNQAAADANGVSLIDINGGKKTLYPLINGGWFV
jgi:hypothetical protein